MASTLDSLLDQLGGERIQKLAGQFGVDEGDMQKAVKAALPAIMGALGRNASRPKEAQAISGALARDHDGSVLDDIDGYIDSGGRLDEGNGILRHALGARQKGVEKGLSATSGLDFASIQKLLPMLAPLVMGALGKKQREDGLDAGGLAGRLGEERKQADSALEGLGPILGALGGGGGLASILGRLFKR
jgi:hypothetical protein